MVTHSESAVRMCPVTRAQSLVPNIWNKLVPPGRIHNDYFQFQAAHNFRSRSIYVLLQNIIFFCVFHCFCVATERQTCTTRLSLRRITMRPSARV